MEYNEQEKETQMMKEKQRHQDLDLDETEDEEVKRNCYGMKYYNTTSCSEDDETESQVSDTDSEEEEDDGNESSSTSTLSSCTESDVSSGDEMEPSSSSMHQPTKFTFDLSKSEPGINICRPKPVSFKKQVEDYSIPLNNGEDHDEEVDLSSLNTNGNSTSQEEVVVEDSDSEVSKADNFDDSSSISSSSASTRSSSTIEEEEEEEAKAIPRSINTSLSYDSDNDASISDNDNDDELDLEEDEEECSDGFSVMDENGEESEKSVGSSLEGDGSVSLSESSISTVSEASTTRAFDGAGIDVQQSFEEEEDREIEIEWDEVLNQRLHFETHHNDDEDSTAAASCSRTATEGSSISAEDLESLMEKEDCSSEMFSSGNSGNCEDQHQVKQLGPTKEFEVKSCTISANKAGSVEKQDPGASNKRSHFTAFGPSPQGVPCLPSLNTHLSALSNFEFFKRGKTTHRALSVCSNDDEVDSQLAEELLGGDSPVSLESKPIPLLTPPASPVPIKSDESVVEIYEWPSGLAVDNALTAAIQLRPLSPSSLAKLERDEQSMEPFVTLYPRKVRSVTRDFSCVGETGVTPVLEDMGIL